MNTVSESKIGSRPGEMHHRQAHCRNTIVRSPDCPELDDWRINYMKYNSVLFYGVIKQCDWLISESVLGSHY